MNELRIVQRRAGVALGLKRLGRERLLEEVKLRVPEPPDGKRWDQLRLSDLIEILQNRVAQGELERLAAEGLATQKAPSVGGPSWTFSGTDIFSPELATAHLDELCEECPDDWEAVTASFESGDLCSIITVKYRSYEAQAIGSTVGLTHRDNVALIFLDFSDGASTVSANTSADALAIGAAWARALGSNESPTELTFEPSASFPPVSPQAVRLLEAVYGRIAEVGTVVNVDRIWVRASDPNAPVQEAVSKGEANHVLEGEDVITSLKRGDHVVGLAFQFDWRYDPEDASRSFVSHVTLNAKTGTVVLTVTRGSHPIPRAAALYQALRKALATPTTEAGMSRVKVQLGKVLE